MPRSSVSRVFKKRKPFNSKQARRKPEESNLQTSNVGSQSCNPTLPKKLTSSKKKLKFDFCKYGDQTDCNQIIDMTLLSQALKESVVCKNCFTSGISVVVSDQRGLAAKLTFICDNCDFQFSFYNSQQKSVVINDTKKMCFEINIRLPYGLRAIGKGVTAGRMLCGILNLPRPMEHFTKYTALLGVYAKQVAEATMLEGIEEAVEENSLECDGENRDISAAFDGTWQKRGHQSLNGVISATCIETGKVIDVSILTKHCLCPNKENHSDTCTANYQGSSGGMEVAGIKEIFAHSIEKYNVRYINYLGDGDSKAYNAVVACKPYGEIPINKFECVNHIQKRMGARLRKLKKELKGKKLDDGLSISGRNRLTDSIIDELQTYYRNAIKNNLHCVRDMKKAVWATYFHRLSTDKNPSHELCPSGPKSWCKYNVNKCNPDSEPYKHTKSIPPAIMSAMKPIYRDLSKEDLLSKCTHGKTQNLNESFNHVLWSVLPKNIFIRMNTFSFGVYEAISSFNKGYQMKCEVLHRIGLKPGFFMVKAMASLDAERVRNSEKSISEYERRAKRSAKRKLEAEYDNQSDYEAGMY